MNDAGLADPRRRVLLLQLMVATGAVAGLSACGGGGDEAAPSPQAPPPPAPEPDPRTPLGRLQRAMRSGTGPTVTATPITVTQGPDNEAVPSQGETALILPTPLGHDVNPNPDSLASLPQVWGHRRDQWTVGPSGYAGTTPHNAGWVRAVTIPHAAQLQSTSGLCGLHFFFDGSAFDVMFGGFSVQVTLVADGEYMTPVHITTETAGGVAGDWLGMHNTYTRFDFGSRKRRRISFYGRSTIGPGAVSADAGDTLEPWDRSLEPSMCVMADSYGQAYASNWGAAGLFWEAAAQLNIPHLDCNAVGSTGYAINHANEDTENPVNMFRSRLPDSVAAEPDLFITAGGINDGFDLFDEVATYYQALRAALPDSVLVALGPWQPRQDDRRNVALTKADAICEALSALPGPWLFVDNLRGGWINSKGASAPQTGVPWQTGNGHEDAPAHDGGNGDDYVGPDGTHPNEAGARYLAGLIADHIRAGVLAL